MPNRRSRVVGQDIVRNMGLFWHRDKVRWKGDRGGGPRLGGRRKSEKAKGVVNFWKQTGIYALYADYVLVYVGQAGLSDKGCFGHRLKQHQKDDLAGRWNMFSWFGLQKVLRDNKVGQRGEVKVTSRAHIANVLEGILIEVAEPPMNSQKGRFGRRVERYIQNDDSDEFAAQADEKIAAIEKLLKDTKKQLTNAVERVSSRLGLKIGRTKTQLSRAIKKIA